MAKLILACLLFCAMPARAQDDPRAAALMREIRCVVCNAQSIADSNAPLAADLRRDVAQRVAAGESDAAIKAGLRQRYGDQILLEPPMRADTLPLWAAPALLLIAALWFGRRLVRRQA